MVVLKKGLVGKIMTRVYHVEFYGMSPLSYYSRRICKYGLGIFGERAAMGLVL